MIFIVGGSCQGKLAFAGTLMEKKRAFMPEVCIADGRTDGIEAAFTADVVYHVECYIRRLLEAEESAASFVERLIAENPHAVVIADEIGCGIVPVSAFERAYRETDGRLCQQLASAASCVYRVVCGIGTKIKG